MIIRLDSIVDLPLDKKEIILQNSKKINNDLIIVNPKIYKLTLSSDANLGLIGKARNLSKSLGKWATTGFTCVSEKTYNERVSICDACEFWQPSGNLGMGKCLKCGCARGKLKIPHEKCPIGKWNSEPLTPPAPV